MSNESQNNDDGVENLISEEKKKKTTKVKTKEKKDNNESNDNICNNNDNDNYDNNDYKGYNYSINKNEDYFQRKNELIMNILNSEDGAIKKCEEKNNPNKNRDSLYGDCPFHLEVQEIQILNGIL